MKGLTQLIETRRRGFKPAHVVIQDDDFDPLMPHWMQVEARDIPERTDLRAVVGCWVTVNGRDVEQVKRWATAAMAAGASTVIAAAFHRVGSRAEPSCFDVLRLHGEDLCTTT
ncbi:hypothetical protein [Roseateles sp.]|uniref:hypothetical protein n=1 Tax=Roseateles sp. TaxID=1971397 RepID=UPI0031E1144B